MSAEDAIARARVAQAVWAALPARSRRRVLRRLRLRFAEQRARIVDAIVADTGKVRLDALAGDVLVTLEQMLFYERRAAWILRGRRVGRSRLFFPGCKFTEEPAPHGVALVFAPANYPFQLGCVPAITALYAGNAVVLKCSERTPETARVLREICAEVLPKDLLQVVEDAPAEAAKYIEALPDIVFFTGSTAAGRRVAERAGALLIPTILELGGKDAAIVCADCDLERTVEGVVFGAFSNAGQVCVGIKRLYVAEGISEEFFSRLRARAVKLHADGQRDFGELRDEGLRLRTAAQAEEALASGAMLLCGNAKDPGAATVLRHVRWGARVLVEESFGPVVCAWTFRTEREAIARANESAFALGASVWTRDVAKGEEIARALNAGTCAVNDVIRPIANPEGSFGGNGESGYGRYHGAAGLLAFSRVRTVMSVGSKSRTERHWFPLSRAKFSALDKLVELRHRPRGWMGALRSVMGRGKTRHDEYAG